MDMGPVETEEIPGKEELEEEETTERWDELQKEGEVNMVLLTTVTRWDLSGVHEPGHLR